MENSAKVALKKKARAKNFTFCQKLNLVHGLAERKHVVQSAFSDTITMEKKTKAWSEKTDW